MGKGGITILFVFVMWCVFLITMPTHHDLACAEAAKAHIVLKECR
jgi:hypothetical protein